MAETEKKQGGFRKISDFAPLAEQRCSDPSHNPPGMIVLEPGIYTYTCPACGMEQHVVVPRKPRL